MDKKKKTRKKRVDSKILIVREVRGAIRKVFARSDMHSSIYERAKVPLDDVCHKVRIVSPRASNFYRCEGCAVVMPRMTRGMGNFQVDHIFPIGTGILNCLNDAQLFYDLVFDYDNLQLLCTDCHNQKTKNERFNGSALSK